MSDNSSGKTEAKSEQERDQSSLQQTSTDQSTSTPINSSRITDERSPQSPPLVTRDELLSRARAFLTSPHVQQQDIIAKRAFLSEKSLTENEIDNLLHTLPLQASDAPPRTYPVATPSHLPVLFLSLVRLFSWFAGGSAVFFFIYRFFVLPRISRTSLARRSLKSDHLSLLRRLTTSLASLKESQAESFSVLPRLDPWKESRPFSECRTVTDICAIAKKNYAGVPPVTILRCGIQDFAKGKEGIEVGPTTEELFGYLEGQIPWLATDDGQQFEQKLWDTLSTSPFFSRSRPPSVSPPPNEFDTPAVWLYVSPTPAPEPPITTSLDGLSLALRGNSPDRKNFCQHTLQSLADFTGYITTQVYLPYRPIGVVDSTNTVQEEVRREIKALKGLVLNRRSFMLSTSNKPTISPNHIVS